VSKERNRGTEQTKVGGVDFYAMTASDKL